jgi:hypothetical protein
MWVMDETSLPVTNVAFAATEANRFGEAANAVLGRKAAVSARAMPNKRVEVVGSFTILLLFLGGL